jgi:ABC-type transport system involved in multi-copper enzyme maturation permease subunit
MAAALYVVLAYMAWMAQPGVAAGWERPALDPAMLKAFLMTFCELAIVTAIAVFFSTFSTPILSAAFTFALFVAGRFSADLRNFNQVIESPLANGLTTALYWVLPNLSPFDVRAQVVHGQPVTASYMALSAGYAVLYIAALVAAAIAVFSRRDFK